MKTHPSSQYLPPKLYCIIVYFWVCETVSLVKHPALCLLSCGLVHPHPAAWWHPAHLPLHSPPEGKNRPAGLSHFRGASISGSFSTRPKKKPNILCWLGGSFTALHLCLLLLQVPLFSTLEVMCWLRLPGGSFFPDTICLHFKLWWKASGNVCLNLQMNQVTPPTWLNSIWISDIYQSHRGFAKPKTFLLSHTPGWILCRGFR